MSQMEPPAYVKGMGLQGVVKRARFERGMEASYSEGGTVMLLCLTLTTYTTFRPSKTVCEALLGEKGLAPCNHVPMNVGT